MSAPGGVGPGAPRRDLSLDFLRGVAILLVLDFHFAPQASLLSAPLGALGWAHFGWIGVDIFFVLSGFLVGGLLVKEWTVRGEVKAGRFLLRRGLKIWPQYYLLVLAMLALHPHRWYALLGNLLNVQNYTAGGSGFDAPLPHTWSLAVEEHFYLILLAVVSFAIWRRARMRTVFWCLAALSVAVSVGRFVWFWRGGTNDVYTHLRLDGLIWGVLLAILYHRAPERFRALQTRWWWLVPLGAVVVFRAQNSLIAKALGISFADWTGVALLLLLYREGPGKGGRPYGVVYRFVAWVGVNSYGIYLWHESVLGPSQVLAGRVPAGAAWLVLAASPWILAISVGVATTLLVEAPMLRVRDRLFPRRVDSAVGMPAEAEIR